MLAYIETSEVIKDQPELDFLGAFTTVAVTNGVSNVLHADKNDGGLTWVIPIGDWEGADLCIPQAGVRVAIRPGDAVAFQANSIAHFNSQVKWGKRLALTCFTDRNMLFPVMRLSSFPQILDMRCMLQSNEHSWLRLQVLYYLSTCTRNVSLLQAGIATLSSGCPA